MGAQHTMVTERVHNLSARAGPAQPYQRNGTGGREKVMADGQTRLATGWRVWLDWRRFMAAVSIGRRAPSARRWTRLAVRRKVLAALLPAVLSLFAASSVQASTGYVDGISDQNMINWDRTGGPGVEGYFKSFFGNAWIGAGHVRYARYVVQFNAMDGSGKANEEPYVKYRKEFEEWVSEAGEMGLTLELAPTSYNGVYPSSPGTYRSALSELLNQAIAEGHPIRYVEPWNEPNQQGGYRKVSEANIPARFDNEAYSLCEAINSKCTIISGNVEDVSEVAAWLREYRKELHGERKIWGVHPYQSVEHTDPYFNFYKGFLEGLPNGGAGDQIWFTEIAARKCKGSEDYGVMAQAEKARYLVSTLIPYAKPEHVFYWSFLYKNREQEPCTDTALYVPGGDPNAWDEPRPGAAFIYADAGFPWAYTGSATATSTSAATLTGSVYPGAGSIHLGGALDSRYHFEYGTTTGYGSVSAEGDAGAALGRVPASIPITGLAEGTTYHYRLVSWNSEGANYGADATFRTAAPEQALNNLLSNASFMWGAPSCSTPLSWKGFSNGGTMYQCSYVEESRAQQGSVFEEMHGTVANVSLAQDLAVSPQPGQSYSFSVWLRAPAGSVTGTVSIYGLKPNEVIGDAANTKFTATGTWQQVTVPLQISTTGETSIRAQVYNGTPNVNLDLDGASLVNAGLSNASFMWGAPSCSTPLSWKGFSNGGTMYQCSYVEESRAQQGSVFEEMHGTVANVSLAQDLAVSPQPGQSYSFSVWLRAPAGSVTGTVSIYGLKPNEVIGDAANTKFTATGTWQQVTVPLQISTTGETSIRAQVYNGTPNVNLDLDGASLVNAGLSNASFMWGAPSCSTPLSWKGFSNGGTMYQCSYVEESRAQQGSVFEEMHGTVANVSLAQDLAVSPQPGQSYSFSVWLRAPAGSVTGTVSIYGLKPNEVIGDAANTKFTATGTWQQVTVPLQISTTGETSIRAQVYNGTPNVNLDLDGASMH